MCTNLAQGVLLTIACHSQKAAFYRVLFFWLLQFPGLLPPSVMPLGASVGDAKVSSRLSLLLQEAAEVQTAHPAWELAGMGSGISVQCNP